LGRIAIVGAGQIGTMMGIALRNAGCTEVFVHDKDPAVAEASAGMGAATATISEISEVLAFDSVILALPVPQIVGFIEDFGPRLKPGSFLVDTGSAKAAVVAAMRIHVPGSVHAIGGHPMVGSELPGPFGARPEMLTDATFVLSRVRTDGVAQARGRALATLAGAKVAEIDADTHDALLARSSHVAHVAAFALASLDETGASDETGALYSPGYASAIRLAASPVEMVAGFLQANGPNVRRAVEEVIVKLRAVCEVVEEDPDRLETLLAQWQEPAARRSVSQVGALS
jgi:cyclohexadieny/prephenate dehydrogenase